MKTNCLFFAIKLWLHRKCQGYIVMRKSYWGSFPHFLYAEKRQKSLRLVSYIPTNPKHKKLPPPIFSGRVKWGD